MRTRNDQPNITTFSFGVDSVFNSKSEYPANTLPPVNNDFLLLDNTNFLLLDGTDLLLLGT